MIRRMCLAQLSLHDVLAAAPRVEEKERMGRGGQRRRQLWEREEDGEKKGERRKQLGKMDEWTDRQTVQTDRLPNSLPSHPPSIPGPSL